MPGESGAEIFYIGKAALPRYLFYTIVAGAQKIHCMVKAQPQNVLQGRNPKMLPVYPAEVNFADKAGFCCLGNCQLGISKMPPDHMYPRGDHGGNGLLGLV